MSETIMVANASRSDLYLPCGTGIPARSSASVSVASLQGYRDHPVVKAWFDERALIPAEPIPEPAPAPTKAAAPTQPPAPAPAPAPAKAPAEKPKASKDS